MKQVLSLQNHHQYFYCHFSATKYLLTVKGDDTKLVILHWNLPNKRKGEEDLKNLKISVVFLHLMLSHCFEKQNPALKSDQLQFQRCSNKELGV
jgi:hypothetical protein